MGLSGNKRGWGRFRTDARTAIAQPPKWLAVEEEGDVNGGHQRLDKILAVPKVGNALVPKGQA